MKTKTLLIGIFGFIAAGAVFVSAAGEEKTAPPELPAIRAATSVVFTRFVRQEGKEERFVVSDARQVQELVSGIHLEPGMALNDLHYDRAIFKGPSGEISTSLCPQCFTIHNRKGEERTYAMPKEFYAAFQKLAQQHGWK